MEEQQITKEDALFYLEMIGMRNSHSYQRITRRRRPCYQLFKRRETEEYKRFINVYHHFKEILTERQIGVLDLVYGVTGEVLTYSQIAKPLGITSSGVGKIRLDAEYRLKRQIGYFVREKELSSPL
ncbi:hypothetical protein [Alkalihalobacterium chitinilyticum]|uniref:Sigma-70 family RNA polymerase sigma factor n=1 Tax=Alkalihalobacterium chitinilyticum TaxID=2980103 RepID=A0ABT5VLF3_9BACI|nr:hypothetical protein [Alkalihalobacterium chitinilyticum]MDE5416276.1 hypothetical protein [Alkalihalobacterium chitinilyticum]